LKCKSNISTCRDREYTTIAKLILRASNKVNAARSVARCGSASLSHDASTRCAATRLVASWRRSVPKLTWSRAANVRQPGAEAILLEAKARRPERSFVRSKSFRRAEKGDSNWPRSSAIAGRGARNTVFEGRPCRSFLGRATAGPRAVANETHRRGGRIFLACPRASAPGRPDIWIGLTFEKTREKL